MQHSITVPISEFDIELFKELIYRGTAPITWNFTADTGEEVRITFVNENDYEDTEDE